MTQAKQPDTWTRFAIERESAAKTLGEFRAVLATNGEASDGHILSIDGMRVPDSMPMLFRHQSTAEIPTLGRITSPSKSRDGGEEMLRVTGNFDLEGDSDDPLLAIRRGFASLVQQGSLDAMSVRWDPVFGKFVPRSSLDKEHFAFADRDGPNAFGMFFEESIAREGSIVAIGSDAAALMGRSEVATSDIERRAFAILAGELEPEEAARGLDPQYAPLIEAMRGVVVEELSKHSDEIFQLVREHEAELGESLLDEANAKAEAKRTSREVPVETKETETKEAEPRKLDLAGLRDLFEESASEGATRRVDFALGRITR